MDDVSSYTNEQVGAAARVVHGGCQKVFVEYFSVAPVSGESEGELISLEAQTDNKMLHWKLHGQASSINEKVKGTLVHKGWQTKEVNLPESSQLENSSSYIITPAELEVIS